MRKVQDQRTIINEVVFGVKLRNLVSGCWCRHNYLSAFRKSLSNPLSKTFEVHYAIDCKIMSTRQFIFIKRTDKFPELQLPEQDNWSPPRTLFLKVSFLYSSPSPNCYIFCSLQTSRNYFWHVLCVLHVQLISCLFLSFPFVFIAQPRGPPQVKVFLIKLRHTSVGRFSLDEGSVRRKDLYLTTRNTERDRHLCHRQDSKPQSQEMIRRRTSPYTAWPLRSASLFNPSKNQ